MKTIKQWSLLTLKQQSYYIITKSGLFIFKIQKLSHNENNSLACYAPTYTE